MEMEARLMEPLLVARRMVMILSRTAQVRTLLLVAVPPVVVEVAVVEVVVEADTRLTLPSTTQ